MAPETKIPTAAPSMAENGANRKITQKDPQVEFLNSPLLQNYKNCVPLAVSSQWRRQGWCNMDI